MNNYSKRMWINKQKKIWQNKNKERYLQYYKSRKNNKMETLTKTTDIKKASIMTKI